MTRLRRLPRNHAAADRGSASAFTVSVFVVFVASAALVIDGGRFVAARTDAADVAENAARAGAQQLHQLRAGSFAVDANLAIAAAQAHARKEGHVGTATADARSVTVTVTAQVSPSLLGLFGVGPRTVRVTRSASPFDR